MNYPRTSLFLIRKYYRGAKLKLGVSNQGLQLLLISYRELAVGAIACDPCLGLKNMLV
jgi:hypothetical protein